MNKVFFILLGIVCSFFGVLILIKPTYYDSQLGFYFDFTRIRWPFGIFIVVVGILITVVALKRKASDFEEEFFICPKCEKSYRKSEVPGMQCPDCKVELEKLKGYYDSKKEKEKE